MASDSPPTSRRPRCRCRRRRRGLRLPSIRTFAVALLCTLSLTAADRAQGATCTFLTSGDWGPIGSYSGLTDCGTIQGDEELVIPSGVSVRVVDDIVQAGGIDARITVEAGGSLVVSALDRQPAAGRTVVSLNDGGIWCLSGSTCTFAGGYRPVASATPALVDDVSLAGRSVVESMLPCPGFDASLGEWRSDCDSLLTDPGDRAGLAQENGFFFAPTTENLARHIPESLDAMEPGDVLCFSDGDPGTPEAPVDDGFCYEVTEVSGDPSGAAPSYLIIDLRQTAPHSPRETTYPLALRENRVSTLVANVSQGARHAAVGASALQGIRPRERVGMWLRFAAADGSPEPLAARISRTWNDPAPGEAPIDCPGVDPCDVVEIYDPAGFGASHDAAKSVWLGFGHGPGDEFFVMSPVVLTDADGVANPDLSRSFSFASTLRLVATLVDRTSGVLIESDANLVELRDLWLRDVVAGGATIPANGRKLKVLVHGGERLLRVSSTGGSPPGVPDRTHGIVLDTDDSDVEDVRIFGLGVRHHGDDCLGVTADVGVTVVRYRCEWSAAEAESCNPIDLGGSPDERIVFSDIQCIDCTDSSPLVNMSDADEVRIIGAARWGEVGRFEQGDSTGLVVRDLLSVGGDGRLPLSVSRFVVALTDTRPAFGTGVLIDKPQLDVRNGIIRDVVRSSAIIARAPEDGVLENVAFIDVDTDGDCATSATCSVLILGPASDDARVTDVTIAYSPDATTQIEYGARATSLSDLTVDGLLVSRMNRSLSNGTGIFGNLTAMDTTFDSTTRGPCLHEVSAPAQQPAGLPPSTHELAGPILVDAAAGRFDPIPGGPADLVPCGVRSGPEAPGMHQTRWIHSISRIAPEVMADAPTPQPDPDPCLDDRDGDGFLSCEDVCPDVFDPEQDDADDDGLGDACEHGCADGLDNDGDGAIDWDGGPAGEPADEFCQGPDQNREAPRSCGLGAELLLVAWSLRRILGRG
ncbi:MAG: hypothetical protein ACQGVK_21645 [Myxococcota bacterium]